MILDQLSLLVDELEAQRVWLNRIPPSQMEGKPMEDSLSLIQMYEQLSSRERDVHLGSLDLDGPPRNTSPGIGLILDSVIAMRRQWISRLSDLPSASWQTPSKGDDQKTVFDVAFEATQSDASSLRSIAERLNESQITFSS